MAQAQATLLARPRVDGPPNRSSRPAIARPQPTRSPAASSDRPCQQRSSRLIGHQPDGLGHRRRGTVEVAALGVEAGQGVPDGSVERCAARGRLGVSRPRPRSHRPCLV